MLESAIAQLSLATTLAFGRPFARWSLELLINALRNTRAEFGPISAEVHEALNGPPLDAETRQEMQFRRFRAQAIQAQKTPYYARLFAQIGINPARLSRHDLAQLPLTTKAAVREHPDHFVHPNRRPYLYATTTGTTGEPTNICFSAHELQVYCALQAIQLLLSGDIQADDIVQISSSSRGLLGNLCMAGACAHVGALVTTTGVIEPAAALARLTAKHTIAGKQPQVTVLYTYASYLGQLVEQGLQTGQRPADFGLRLIIVGGEVVTPGLCQRAQALFGPVRFAEGYGITELWPFGGRLCEQGHLHFEAAQGLLELLDPVTGAPVAPGAVGALVATPLPPFRETTLLLRYNTEDLVQRLAEPLTCSQRHTPATSHLLGKLRLAVRHDAGWSYPRQLLTALEGVADVPLPARAGFWAAPGGVGVAVVARRDTPQVRRTIALALEEQGLPLRALHLVDAPTHLRHALPLRCDLREDGFRPPMMSRAY